MTLGNSKHAQDSKKTKPHRAKNPLEKSRLNLQQREGRALREPSSTAGDSSPRFLEDFHDGLQQRLIHLTAPEEELLQFWTNVKQSGTPRPVEVGTMASTDEVKHLSIPVQSECQALGIGGFRRNIKMELRYCNHKRT